jgi:ankyrin repeat protein
MFGRNQDKKYRELMAAIKAGSPDDVRAALRRGAPPDRFGESSSGGPLVEAVSLASEETSLAVVTALLEKGARTDKYDSDGETPLHYLIKRNGGHLAVLKKLVDAGANPLAVYGSRTPLYSALAYMAWPAANVLFGMRPDQVVPMADGMTGLMLAAKGGAPLALLEKLCGPGGDINAAGAEGTALCVAAAGNKTEAAEFLLGRAGVNVNIADKNGKTPLHFAAALGNEEVAARLVDARADLNTADANGVTPLLAALSAGKREMAAGLLAAGAVPYIADKAGLTPLEAAAALEAQDLVKALLAAGADPYAASAGGSAPLTRIALLGAPGPLSCLLSAMRDAGKPIDLRSALCTAAEVANCDAITRLADAGADLDAGAEGGVTALMKAALAEHVGVMSLLISRGAKPEVRDARGMRAYDHAVSAGRQKSKEYLFQHQGADASSAEDAERYVRLSDHSLEVREGPNLAVIFNFWMQQVVFRNPSQPAPVTVQAFSEVPRQEAIEDAFHKLQELGGHPPEPTTSLRKSAPGLKAV